MTKDAFVAPDIPAPRRPPRRVLADEPLPPYRYVPDGAHPHPVTSTEGHFAVAWRTRDDGLFQGRAFTAPEPTTPLAWMVTPLWLYGVDLFNYRYFWEAHEAWEPLWRALDKAEPPGMFVQGLMQCSAAMLKVHIGNLDGVLALWGKAEVRLGQCSKVSDELWGLSPKRTFKAFSSYFAPAVKKGRVPKLDDAPALKLAL